MQNDKNDSYEYRKALGNFATGIVLIIGHDKVTQKPFAITINSFSSVSLEPKIISWCLGSSNKYKPNFLYTKYCIQILSYQHQNLALQFSKTQFSQDFSQDFFDEYASNLTNLPIAKQCLAYFECEYYTSYQVGDHELFLAKVLKFHNFNQEKSMEALSFFNGKMGKIIP